MTEFHRVAELASQGPEYIQEYMRVLEDECDQNLKELDYQAVDWYKDWLNRYAIAVEAKHLLADIDRIPQF